MKMDSINLLFHILIQQVLKTETQEATSVWGQGSTQSNLVFTEAPKGQRGPSQQSVAAHRNLSGKPCKSVYDFIPSERLQNPSGELEGLSHVKVTQSNPIWGKMQCEPHTSSSPILKDLSPV